MPCKNPRGLATLGSGHRNFCKFLSKFCSKKFFFGVLSSLQALGRSKRKVLFEIRKKDYFDPDIMIPFLIKAFFFVFTKLKTKMCNE